MSYEKTQDHTGTDTQEGADPQRDRSPGTAPEGCPEDAFRGRVQGALSADQGPVSEQYRGLRSPGGAAHPHLRRAEVFRV